MVRCGGPWSGAPERPATTTKYFQHEILHSSLSLEYLWQTWMHIYCLLTTKVVEACKIHLCFRNGLQPKDYRLEHAWDTRLYRMPPQGTEDLSCCFVIKTYQTSENNERRPLTSSETTSWQLFIVSARRLTRSISHLLVSLFTGLLFPFQPLL